MTSSFDEQIIYGFYSMVYAYYYYNSVSIFSMDILALTSLLASLIYLRTRADSLNDDQKNMIKFVGHIMFFSFNVILFTDFCSFLYRTIFYFGFTRTIVLSNCTSMLFLSGTMKLFGEKISDYLSKYHTGRLILDTINYYYNTYIVAENMIARVNTVYKYIVHDIIQKNAERLVKDFDHLNGFLSDNPWSKKVAIIKVKNNNMFHPDLMNSINQNLNNDQVSICELDGLDIMMQDMYNSMNIPILRDVTDNSIMIEEDLDDSPSRPTVSNSETSSSSETNKSNMPESKDLLKQALNNKKNMRLGKAPGGMTNVSLQDMMKNMMGNMPPPPSVHDLDKIQNMSDQEVMQMNQIMESIGLPPMDLDRIKQMAKNFQNGQF